MKLLIWLAIVALVVAWVVRSKKKPVQKEASQGKTKASNRNGQAEAMLQCSRCGMYFPASEAITPASGMVFCSEEHRRQVFPGD